MCVCAPLEEVAPDTYNNLIPMFPHDFWQTHELPKPLTLRPSVYCCRLMT